MTYNQFLFNPPETLSSLKPTRIFGAKYSFKFTQLEIFYVWNRYSSNPSRCTKSSSLLYGLLVCVPLNGAKKRFHPLAEDVRDSQSFPLIQKSLTSLSLNKLSCADAKS